MSSLYSFSGRIIFIVLYPLVKLFPAPRTRVLVTDGKGKVLLVRGWFGHQKWDLPGGGIKRKELPEEAASREVLEETGVGLKASQLRLIGKFSKNTSNLSHGVILFHARADASEAKSLSRHRQLEILESKWWPINRLPPKINMFVLRALRKAEEIEA